MFFLNKFENTKYEFEMNTKILHGQRKFQGKKRKKKRKQNYHRQQTVPSPTIGITLKGRTSQHFQRHGEGGLWLLGGIARIVQMARATNIQNVYENNFLFAFFYIFFYI